MQGLIHVDAEHAFAFEEQDTPARDFLILPTPKFWPQSLKHRPEVDVVKLAVDSFRGVDTPISNGVSALKSLPLRTQKMASLGSVFRRATVLPSDDSEEM